MMIMFLVCEIRFFYSVYCCCWSFFCFLRRSIVVDYFFKFGGYIFYEEIGKYVIICYFEIGEGVEGFMKEEVNERYDS